MDEYDFFCNNPLLLAPDYPLWLYPEQMQIPWLLKFYFPFSWPLRTYFPKDQYPVIQCLTSKLDNLKHCILSVTHKNIPITAIACKNLANP